METEGTPQIDAETKRVADIAVEAATVALEAAQKSFKDEQAAGQKSISDQLDARFEKLSEDLNQKIKGLSPEEVNRMEVAEFTMKQVFAMVARDEKRIAGLNEELKSMGVIKNQNSTNNPDGGYLVHPEFAREIIRCVEEMNCLEKYTTRHVIRGNSFLINQLISDVACYWVGECAEFTESNVAFGQIEIKLNKLGGYTIFCNELLEDQMDIPALFDLLVERFAMCLCKKIDCAILNGNDKGAGSGGFTGVINATAANGFTQAAGYASGPVNVVESQAGSQIASGIVYDDLLNMFFAIDDCWLEGRGSNIAWVMHKTMLLQIMQMKDADGKPCFTPVGANTLDNLFSYPVFTNDCMPAVTNTVAGDAGTTFIVFGNWKWIYFLYKGDMKVDIFKEASFKNTISGQIERLAEQDKTALRVKRRLGFHVVAPGAFSLYMTAA